MTATPSLQPSADDKVRVWDLPTRLFHWTLAAAIIVALLSGEEDSALAGWHHPAGWLVVALLAFRIVWGLIGGEHARFVNFIKPSHIGTHIKGLTSRSGAHHLGHNPLGGIAVLGLLGLSALTVGTGIQLLSGGAEDWHEVFAYALLALVVVHVIAVIAMSVLSRESLIGAMITGRKSRARHPGAVDARRAGPLALATALGVIALTGFVASRVDPAAFEPSTRAEAGGHEEEEDD